MMTSVTERATTSPPRPPAGRRRPRRSAADRSTVDGLVFLAPFLVVYALFLLFPVAQAFVLSLQDRDLLGGTSEFVGADNYVRMLGGTGLVWTLGHLWLLRLALVAAGVAAVAAGRRRSSRLRLVLGVVAVLLAVVLGVHPGPGGAWNDPAFWVSLGNTLVFTAVSTPLLVGVGLAMALALNTGRRGTGLYRAAFFLPYVLPVSAVTLVWSYLLNPDRGLVAGFLGLFGLEGIGFLSSPALALPAIIVTTLWWGVGFNLVLFLAGLQDIEPSLYEAASLDGAGAVQRFVNVTVPGLTHVFVLVGVSQLIASFQIFGQVYIMTRGGPGTSTRVLIQHIYETGFQDYQLGYAAAVSVFLFVVMAVVSSVQFRVLSGRSS